MEEILQNYQGIIGAISGTVLGTVSTLITTHILKNYGRVETSIFDVEFEHYEQDAFQLYERIRLDFKVKFHNTSETYKVLDNFEVVFLNDKNFELFKVPPDDIDTFRSTQHSVYIDKLYFVNLSPKQLTLKKLKVEVTDRMIKNLDNIKCIELRYADRRKRKYVIYNKKKTD